MQQKSPEELYNLGLKNQYAKDYKLAFYYFRQAAEAGSREAMHKLAHIYLNNSRIVKLNINEAIKWLDKAEEWDVIANIYFLGEYVKRDISKAIEYFTKAANNLDDANSAWQLAEIFYFGIDVPKDYIEADKWYKCAFNLYSRIRIDDIDGAERLGEMYFYGLGTERDESKAVELFDRVIDIIFKTSTFVEYDDDHYKELEMERRRLI